MQWRALGSAAAVNRTAAVIAATFAAVAAVGVLLKAVGGSAIGIVFGAAGALGGFVAVGFAVLRAYAEQREAERSTLRLAPDDTPPFLRVCEALGSDAMYRFGVEREAPQALARLGLSPEAHAPYLPRADADARLRERLRAAAACEGVSLVVLAGPSKAGKSRTLAEALQDTLPGAWLLRPASGAAALVMLALAGAPSGIGAGVCVLWLDDLEDWVGYGDAGLNAQTIAMFESWRRPVVLVAGYQGRRNSSIDELKDPAEDLLRRFPPVELLPRLTPTELRAAQDDPAYRAVADDLASQGVGEFMIVADKIRTLLTLTQPADRDGIAVADATIDWRRCGLRRAMPPDALAALYSIYMDGPPSDARLERGLEVATRRLFATVALVSHTADGYLPFDYAVQVRDNEDRAIPRAVWELILGRYARASELLAIGAQALSRHELEVCAKAIRRADEGGTPDGAFALGYVLRLRGDVAGAEAAYRRADERGHAEAAAELGMLSYEQDNLQAAATAYGRADGRGSAAGAHGLGVVLEWWGDLTGAEAAYRRADERGHAAAAVALGMLLWKRGDLAGALAASRRADERGDPGGAYNVGVLLSRGGDHHGAEAAYRRADSRGSMSGSFAWGTLLYGRGDLDGAEAALRRATERGDTNAATLLGELLDKRGQGEAAERRQRPADS